MNLQVATIPEFVGRGATFVLVFCFLVLESTDVLKAVPLDHRQLAYRAMLEIILLLLLLRRLDDTSFVRDMVDITIYFLVVLLILLLTYLVYAPVYAWLIRYFVSPFIVMLDILILVRLLWGSKIDGQWCPGRWPRIGLHGWLAPALANLPPVSRDERILVGLAVLVCAAIGLSVSGSAYQNTAILALYASCGIIVIAIYAKPISRALQILLMNSEERHNVIMQYEEVIIRSRDALDILKNLEAQADTKRENVVRLVPNKPDEDSE